MKDSASPIEHRLTPMMAQYVEIKAANPDSLLFYRMGDFYEMFFDDAVIAARTLSITLTKRGQYQGQDIPMCGVPVERADDYLQRLIAAGHRVAVCDQLEDPAEAKKRGAKSVVKRDVVRLVTAGTITEDNLLNPSRANVLLSVTRDQKNDYALGMVDISTGHFQVVSTTLTHLSAQIARFEPSEIIMPRALFEDQLLAPVLQDIRVPCVPLGVALSSEPAQRVSEERRIVDFYQVASLEAFGAFSNAEISAISLILFYIERTQRAQRPVLSPPQKERQDAFLTIDAATRANLEITKTLSGERSGSLLDTIDHTLTAAGGRLLAQWLAAPLTDLAQLRQRHDAVAFFVAHHGICQQVRDHLKALPDLERALGRIALERGGPRDLSAIAQGLEGAANLACVLVDFLKTHPTQATLIHKGAQDVAQTDQTLAQRLRQTLSDTPPLLKRDGQFIKEGASPELDECRVLQNDSRRYIVALQARYASETGCRQLKIKHNNMIGYFVEVPQANGEDFLQEPWRSVFVHRQTMAGAMRFSTLELSDLESRIAAASGKALALELSLYDTLAHEILAQSHVLKKLAEIFAQFDVITALAHLAVERSWVRPHLDDTLAFEIVEGRHPVVEKALKKQGIPFIANPCQLLYPQKGLLAHEPQKGAINLMTGPNMAGKSTYLRQNALIVILAQMGSFVPALSAHIGIVDQVFSRVGAADDLARGRSTFMVEMIETATILHQASHRSLVILDEIGRGTATFDGLSLAWACVEHLHEIIGCRALFATHFHELTALSKRLERLKNITMKVTDWKGDVVFLHEVAQGAADRSYGIHVAKKAGLPESVIARAQILLNELERNDRERPAARVVDDLPLFAVASQLRHTQPAPKLDPDPIHALLKTIDPDALTPKQALEMLYTLKAKAE